MAKKINYEDDIFYLIVLIRRLGEGLKLDLDTHFFLDKIADDLFFIDETMEKISTSLESNIHLIKREKYLRDFKRAERRLIRILDDVIENKVEFSEQLQPFLEKLKKIKENHSQSMERIGGLLSRILNQTPEEDIISEEEFRYLLSDEEEKTS